jgi:hypothetical protein
MRAAGISDNESVFGFVAVVHMLCQEESLMVHSNVMCTVGFNAVLGKAVSVERHSRCGNTIVSHVANVTRFEPGTRQIPCLELFDRAPGEHQADASVILSVLGPHPRFVPADFGRIWINRGLALVKGDYGRGVCAETRDSAFHSDDAVKYWMGVAVEVFGHIWQRPAYHVQ